MELIETLSSEWAIRAILASSMVGVMCGIIGCFIVLRNMSMIGDALSHAILPGIFLAFVLVGYSTIGFFAGSVFAGLLAAVMITWLQHNSSTKNDAVIGIVFTAMFSLGVIGISWLSQEQGAHLDLKDFLFGNILGISTEDLIITGVVTIYTIVSVALLYRYLFITTFQPTIAQTMGISVKSIHYFLMLLLSFSVVAALRSVGVILVVAMLITPASTALLLSERLKKVVVIAAACGLISAVGGMILAILWDTTPGPLMVIVATVIYLVAVIFSPKRGYLTRKIEKRRQSNKVEREDIIKWALKNSSVTSSQIDNMREDLGLAPGKADRHLRFLKDEGLIIEKNNNINLTLKGKSEAEQLVRAHRLWESYQVNKMGLTTAQIHDEAERLEHFLSEEILDEVDKNLGFPHKDPHGSPIPPKHVIREDALLNLKLKSRSTISEKQHNESIESELWELGILPNTTFSVVKIGSDFVEIQIGKKQVTIPAQLAKEIRVKSM